GAGGRVVGGHDGPGAGCRRVTGAGWRGRGWPWAGWWGRGWPWAGWWGRGWHSHQRDPSEPGVLACSARRAESSVAEGGATTSRLPETASSQPVPACACSAVTPGYTPVRSTSR